ncbi:MAG TPA: hypothetical protein VK968_17005 [Roseimicrobium sp.]|nr:hypothetical protein [Roseimicrobium sp.]
MKAKDIFGLAVRLLGLLLFYHSYMSLPMVISNIPMLVIVACNVLVGWWLVGGAPQLMRRAYPEEKVEPVKAPESPQ